MRAVRLFYFRLSGFLNRKIDVVKNKQHSLFDLVPPMT